MDRRAELKQLYKEMKTEAGVYRITNRQNGKVFIGSTMNLKTVNGTRFQLKFGSHKNSKLQQEWNEYGEDAFDIEVVERLEVKEDKYAEAKDALKKLEEKWLEQLQPFGERGYH
ncbi:GIY-YIG nuclease family protein [Brevibacillus thermoruber]|jgi:GIY-YIG catalytic domain|uniref:GIY-YIG nuclease family protein n=1 Tax=Brevibacillus thermoruber TaxID=33942 RepID=UPI0005D11749